MAKLTVENMRVQMKNTTLVKDASLTLEAGELIALIGPNGAGKTSLLRAALGLGPATSGYVTLDGADVSKLSPIRRARKIAYLPQMRPLAWPNRVWDIVALGRYAHGGFAGRLTVSDIEAITYAIEACDIAHLAQRKADSLSGGELARMHCARAFAAKAPLLIADEPVAALDPRHQYRVMDLMRNYVDQGTGVLVVLHDIKLAAKYADRLLWMKAGKIIADGTVADTLTEKRMAEIFGVRAKVIGESIDVIGVL